MPSPQMEERRKRRDDSTRDSRDDLRVIRYKDWYESKGMSKWAADRMRRAGKGPRIVQLGPRMIGVTVRDDREWTEARIREGA